MPRTVPLTAAHVGPSAVLAVAAFVVLAASILSQPAKKASDFDQRVYTTIAYVLDRHGVFSDRAFGDLKVGAAPRAGMISGWMKNARRLRAPVPRP
jgi:hypothetical protein